MLYEYIKKTIHHVASSFWSQTGLFGIGSAFVHVAT